MSTDMIHTLQQEADEHVRPFANNVLCVCFFIIGTLASLYAALAVFEAAQLVLFVVSFFAWVFIIPFLDLALSAAIAGAVAAGGIYLSYKLAQGLDYLLKHIGGWLMGLVSVGCAIAFVWMQFTLPIQLEFWQEELLGLLLMGAMLSLFFTRFALYPLFLLVLIVNLLFYLVFYKGIEPYIPPEKRLSYTQEQPALEENALDEEARLNAYGATLVPVPAQMYQEAYTPSATTLQPTEARFRIFGKPPKGAAKGAKPLPKTKAVTSRLLVWGKKVLPSMKKGLRAFSRSGVVAKPARGIRVWSRNKAAEAKLPKGSKVKAVNGSLPKNYAYAGKTFRLSGELGSKYPKGVRFNERGFPDLVPYLHTNPNLPNLRNTVRIRMTGSYSADFSRANKAAGITESYRVRNRLTWHHHQREGRMELVPSDLHNSFRHTGGVAKWKQRTGIKDYKR